MMNEGTFLVVIFALLLSYQKLQASKYQPLKKGAYLFFDEALEIFLQGVSLLLIYTLVVQFLLQAQWHQDAVILFSVLGAYFFKQLRKMGEIVFLIVFALFFWIQWEHVDLPLWEQIWMLARMVIGMAAFQMLLTGLQEKLLLSDIPKPLRGAPIFLLSACLLALAFGEIWIFTP